MNGYTAIAKTGERLAALLRRELVPGVIASENGIGLRSPKEHGDVSLGLFLYDIQECAELQQRGRINTHINRQTYPPLFLSLYYMITAYCDADLKFRMAQEQRLLGGVVQTFHDYALLPAGEAQENGGMDLHVQFQRLTMEEKGRIWNFQGLSYQLSLFYKVSPVVMESGREREVTRVMHTEIGVVPMQGAGRENWVV